MKNISTREKFSLCVKSEKREGKIFLDNWQFELNDELFNLNGSTWVEFNGAAMNLRWETFGWNEGNLALIGSENARMLAMLMNN